MTIHYEQRDHIGLITIDRPERKGAMNWEAYEQLAAAWRSVILTPSIRVAVITGVQDSYCAGADLAELIPGVASEARARLEGRPAGESADLPELSPGAVAVLRDIEFPKPIVAAVNGPCVASGMEMLLGTDIRLASPNAVFGLPEVRRGLFASGGSTVRLARQIPFVHAMDILLTGRYISAVEAEKIGLINRVVERENLLDEALKFAELIARNSPTAVYATKRSVMRTSSRPLHDAYEIEMGISDTVFGAVDAVEGPRAFLEKRQPVWSDDGLGEIPAWAGRG